MEEQPAHTIIGNVAADVQLDTVYIKEPEHKVYSKDELTSLRYQLIAVVWNQPLQNDDKDDNDDDDDELSDFTLDADTGLLTTSKVVPSSFL